MKNQKSAVIVILITFFLVLFIFWHSKRIREIKPWQRFEKDPQNSCMYCSNSTPKEIEYSEGLFNCPSCKECSVVQTSVGVIAVSFMFSFFTVFFLLIPISNTFFDNALALVGNLFLFLF